MSALKTRDSLVSVGKVEVQTMDSRRNSLADSTLIFERNILQETMAISCVADTTRCLLHWRRFPQSDRGINQDHSELRPSHEEGRRRENGADPQPRLDYHKSNSLRDTRALILWRELVVGTWFDEYYRASTRGFRQWRDTEMYMLPPYLLPSRELLL